MSTNSRSVSSQGCRAKGWISGSFSLFGGLGARKACHDAPLKPSLLFIYAISSRPRVCPAEPVACHPPSPSDKLPPVKKAVVHEIERQLNPEQVAAVTHGEGPQLVLAGAGSGKTRVITHRIYWLIEEMGADPGTIAAMTFTNKAAGEMRERVEDLLNLHPLPTSVGTFHRYGLMMMRRYGERVGLRRDFHILDGSDQIGLIKEALTAEGLSETAFSPRSVLSNISAAKNKLLDPPAYESKAQNFFEKKVATLYRRYQWLLHAASGVDFDDLIALPVKLLSTDEEIKTRTRRWTRLLPVDEDQDTNPAQP